MTNKQNPLLLLSLLCALSLQAQQATLLKEINPGTGDGIIFDNVAVANDKYFFYGTSPAEGMELWVSDGSPAGTQLVKDIDPGQNNGISGSLVVFKDKVWFAGTDPAQGQELWSSDGTLAGTSAIEIRPGAGGSSIGHLAAGTEHLYFTANDGVFTGLYRTDGTPTGTTLITNDLGTASAGFIDAIVTIGDIAYMALAGPTAGQLWTSDGTAAGTVMVADINPGDFGQIKQLTAANGKLYFAGSPNFFGDYQPWVSNGGAAGTMKLKDISPSSNADPKWFFPFKGKVYFHANDQNLTKGFYRTDGTPAGTELFKDIAISSFNGEARNLVADDNYLYFSGNDFDLGQELFQTDGTVAGTKLVKDLDPGFWSSYPRNMAFGNGKLYFSANVGGNGEELCVSDGSEGGTQQFTDLYHNSSNSSTPNSIRQVGNSLIFQAKHPLYGRELFVLDITSGTGAPQPDIAISVFPNPSTDLLKVLLPQDMETAVGSLRLINIDGRTVWQSEQIQKETWIPVAGLPAGQYWLSFRSGQHWGRESVVVIH